MSEEKSALINAKDLLGLEKPLVKLIETVEKGVGACFRPYFIRKNALAEAEKIKILADANSVKIKKLAKAKAEAEAEAGKILAQSEAEIDFTKRTYDRFVFQEFKKQKNIENILESSIKYLPKEVSDEPVNEDWISRYFLNAQDISEEHMQDLWAKILAGEVGTPGSYSLRALETVRNMTKEEALIFEKVCHLAFVGGNVLDSEDGKVIAGTDLRPKDEFLLASAGLMHDSALIQFGFNNSRGVLTNNGMHLCFISEGSDNITFYCRKLTKTGEELSKLVAFKPNMDYLRSLAEYCKKRNILMKKINRKEIKNITWSELTKFLEDI